MREIKDGITYLKKLGLHDANIDNIKIDFIKKEVLISFSGFEDVDYNELKIILKKLSLIEIDKQDDLINDEIVLDFNVDVSRMSLFTLSNTKYYFEFEKSEVFAG